MGARNMKDGWGAALPFPMPGSKSRVPLSNVSRRKTTHRYAAAPPGGVSGKVAAARLAASVLAKRIVKIDGKSAHVVVQPESA